MDYWATLHKVNQNKRVYRVDDDFFATGFRPAGTYLPNQLTGGVGRIVNGVRDLFRATDMTQHCKQMPLLARDVCWDAPPILASRKGHLRVAAYIAKFAAYLDLEPQLVQVYNLDGEHDQVEIQCIVHLLPHRSWLFLPSLLLPKDVPINATIKLGVAGGLENGQIELVWGRIHNFPVLPNVVRALSGLAMGGIPHMLEPVWGLGMELAGDEFYTHLRQRKMDQATSKAYDYGSATMDYVHGTSVYHTAANLAGRAQEVANQATQRVSDMAAPVTGKLQEVTGQATQTARQVGNTIGLDRNIRPNAYMNDSPSAAQKAF